MRLPGLLLFLIAVFPLLHGCEKLDRNMYDSPAFKAQEDPVRLPPKDSVPTKGKEHVPPMREAAKLVNPETPTEGALLKGKELYGIFCVPCHGVSGGGDGPVAKKIVPDPADLRPGSKAARRTDGELFSIVTSGAGGMPAFRADLAPRERWHIVAHLRTLK